MKRDVLVTGATGALGPHLLAELLRCAEFGRIFVLLRAGTASVETRFGDLLGTVTRLAAGRNAARPVDPGRLEPVVGDLTLAGLGLDREELDRLTRRVQVIVHAAADTRFLASTAQLERVNVEGTGRVLRLAARCRSLRQFLFVSTACVAGTREGTIPELLLPHPPDFVNGYEETKWRAEQLVASSGLPARIVRLSTCLGDHRSGYVHRFGAIHHCLHWLSRGLIPMLPAAPGARVDMISTDVAARWIARAAGGGVGGPQVCHVTAGARAIPLNDLMRIAVGALREHAAERTVLEQPLLVEPGVFELFRQSIEQSGDLLFTRVLRSAGAFLPALSHPKTFHMENAEACWGGPLPHPDPQTLVERVVDFGCRHGWGLGGAREAAHA